MKHAQSIHNRILSCESIWKQFVILGQSYSQEGILHESFLFAQHIAASLTENHKLRTFLVYLSARCLV